MIKAVFFDIDGTLVPIGSGGIPDSTKLALRMLRESGIKVFISSGRHPAWINNLEDETFDGYVTTNGALCLLGDKKSVVYMRTIDSSDVDNLVKFVHSSDIPFVVVPAEGDLFTTGKDENFMTVTRLLRTPEVPIRAIEDAVGRNVVQMMVFAPKEEIDEIGLFTKVLPHCSGTSWSPYFADIVPEGSDKSVGIDKMLDYFDIDLSESMAFGDGENDMGMLRHVAVGVAMGNASDEVKAVADHVTTDVTADGVMNALRNLGVIK